jgi:threonine dehydratase
MIGVGDVVAAADRLHGVVHRTPVLTSRTLDEQVGASVLLKAECFQRTGSFKARGATNALAVRAAAGRLGGVVTMSSGNHAQALAWAATRFGVPAVVVMPHDAPANKRAATEGYGAEIVTYDRYHEDRDAVAVALARSRGLDLVRPYDDWDVMAGQGTATLELQQERGRFDVLVVPVGGGGLVAGSATVAKALMPGVQVVGVEPEASDDHRRSLAAGRRVALDAVPTTIADGQAALEPGELTFEVTRRRVDHVVTVGDDDIRRAMRFAFERLRVVVEPSGASGLAAVLSGAVGEAIAAGGLAGRRVGVILSGGNIDVERFSALLGPG